MVRASQSRAVTASPAVFSPVAPAERGRQNGPAGSGRNLQRIAGPRLVLGRTIKCDVKPANTLLVCCRVQPLKSGSNLDQLCLEFGQRNVIAAECFACPRSASEAFSVLRLFNLREYETPAL
jgi:hypothetical protein